MRRRSIIKTCGVLIAGVSSGCLSSVRETVNPTTQLGWFGVHNVDTDSSHQFDLEVNRDGERVHTSTHTVDAARELDGGGKYIDGAVAECTWGNTPGDYSVRIRADDSEWVEESITEFALSKDVDCVVAVAEYRSTLSIYLKEGCDRYDYDQMCSFTN